MRVDPSYITNLVGSLDQAQSNEQQLSSELSSGVSITSLSQNPVGAGQNVLLLNQIQQDDSFTASSNLVTGQLQVADSALGSVVSELTQAVSLATSANNGTMSASDVKSIGSQISGILDEVQSLANTSYQGQYIFAGGQTGTAPFSTSTASSPAVTTYSGDEDVNYLELPNGQKIQLNVPGDQVFLGGGTNSVFGALNALVADYSSGTVNTSQAVSDTEALGTALNYVSQQRVTVDNSITQLSAASSAVTNEKTQLTTAQTDLMQADIPTVSTQLSLAETQQTALEDVIAQLESTSNNLFCQAAAVNRGLRRILYTECERASLVRSTAISLECDARAPVCAVAQPLFALARRDLFRPARRNADRQKHSWFCLGFARGTPALSRLDGRDAARSTQASIKRSVPNPR